MKKLFLLPLALGSVLLSSCQDEDFGYESSKIAYEKTMSQMLGEVAPDQTWVNAEQGYVTISEECQNVKVFDGLTGKVIANYNNLRPGSKVYYNATIGYNPTISNGTVAMEVKNGQDVSFKAAGRAVSPISVSYGNTDKTITCFKDVDPSSYVNFKSNFIEKDFHRYKIGDKNIRGNVEFVATGDAVDGKVTFVLYPAYWDSPEHLTIGLYYYDPATSDLVVDKTPIYKNREDNSVLFGNATDKKQSANDWICVGDVTSSNDRTEGGYQKLTQWDVFPIYVSVQENLVFGFWIKGDDDKLYFANPALNDDCTDEACSHSGTFDINAKETYYRRFYPVEDEWAGEAAPLYIGMNANSHKPNGFYDIYFVMKAVRNINYETSSYTLCFEDLGATSWQDMDFNDCVLKLTCANGQKTAGLQLLAAGGRLPIKVTYNGAPVWEKEIHAALGKDLVPVNANQFKTGVTKDVETADAVSATITLPDSWTIQSLVAKIGLDVDGKTQVSIPETTGDYPKGFAVAGDFQWPGEQQNITTVYGDFSTWAAKPDFSYWYPWSAE